jgi:hypothetical protein
MVPLKEWRIPTLIVPPEAAGDSAAGDSAAGDSVVSGALAQAFRSMLVPNAAEPYTKNLRRPKFLVM